MTLQPLQPAAYAEPVVAKRVGCECVRRGWPRAAKFVVIGGAALAGAQVLRELTVAKLSADV